MRTNRLSSNKSNYQKRKIGFWHFLFLVLLVFTFVFVTIALRIKQISMNKKIDRLLVQKQELQRQNERLQARLLEKNSVERISVLAQKKLGLKRPALEKVLFVELEENDQNSKHNKDIANKLKSSVKQRKDNSGEEQGVLAACSRFINKKIKTWFN